MGVIRPNSKNATKRPKLCIFTWADKSAEVAMREFAVQERQAKREKMKMWKNKVMQEMTCELRIIR